MSTAPNISYQKTWTFDEYLCACGVRVRVDIETFQQSFASAEFEHNCGKDTAAHVLPGRVLAVWEERSGQWVGIWGQPYSDSWSKVVGKATLKYSTEGVTGCGFSHNCDVESGTLTTRVTTLQTTPQISREEVERRFNSNPEVAEFIARVSSEGSV